MALRANDADGYKSLLALGIEQLGMDVAAEVESDWMVPLLVEEEKDRLMAWQLGVSFKTFFQRSARISPLKAAASISALCCTSFLRYRGSGTTESLIDTVPSSFVHFSPRI